MKKFVRIIIKNKNKYLLIKEVKSDNYNTWNFPGGKIDKDEDIQTAAIRELKEETNLNPKKMDLIHETECSFNNEPWYGYYFIGNEINFDDLKIMEPHHCEAFNFFTLDEIKKLDTGTPINVLLCLEKLV